jgi:hypothetical protein
LFFSEIVLDQRAFAMNPTVPAAKTLKPQNRKTEDTILVQKQEAENFTAALAWPKINLALDGCTPLRAF